MHKGGGKRGQVWKEGCGCGNQLVERGRCGRRGVDVVTKWLKGVGG